MTKRRTVPSTLSEAEAEALRRKWRREAQRRYRQKLRKAKAPSYDDLVYALGRAFKVMAAHQEEEIALLRLTHGVVDDLAALGYSPDAVWRQLHRTLFYQRPPPRRSS